MDSSGELISAVVKQYLPPSAAAFINTHVLAPNSYTQQFLGRASAALQQFAAVVTPMLEQVWLYAWGLVLRSPDIVGLALLLVIVLSALQVLLVARRVVGWIVGAVVRVAFWSAVVLVLSVLYQRGLEATVRDALAIGEKVWGYAVVTAEIWRREYARYSAEAAAAGSSRRAAAAGRYDWSQGRRKTR